MPLLFGFELRVEGPFLRVVSDLDLRHELLVRGAESVLLQVKQQAVSYLLRL